MNKETKYRIHTGVSVGEYQALILRLYEQYPNVARSKVMEFEKAFSPENPFFRFAKVMNFYVYDSNDVVGHIAAIVDSRLGEIGIIGFFECENKQGYADCLFGEANKFLKDAGLKECRGPINMNVWLNSRVSYPEDHQPFFLEPFTLMYYRELFLNGGYVVDHQNITISESIEKTKIRNYEKYYSQSIADGYRYQTLTSENAMECVHDIYALTSTIFEGSYSFCKITEEEFLYFAEQYTKNHGQNYIFILKNADDVSVGFFFAMPDLFNHREKSVVLKTMGLLPPYQGKNLGSAMLYFVYQEAKRGGYERLISSTMSVDNNRILSIADQNTVPYRKYEVFKKELL